MSLVCPRTLNLTGGNLQWQVNGGTVQEACRESPDPLGSGFTVQQHRLGFILEAAQSRTQHEPQGKLS